MIEGTLIDELLIALEREEADYEIDFIVDDILEYD